MSNNDLDNVGTYVYKEISGTAVTANTYTTISSNLFTTLNITSGFWLCSIICRVYDYNTSTLLLLFGGTNAENMIATNYKPAGASYTLKINTVLPIRYSPQSAPVLAIQSDYNCTIVTSLGCTRVSK